jgi:hypothetical protein
VLGFAGRTLATPPERKAIMTRETETGPAEFRKEPQGERSEDTPPESPREDDASDHRFRDWALI